jgi:hypothetical protein
MHWNGHSDGFSHLPAYLIAAFIKRMARLSLHAPPAGILITLPLIYNLIKLHPECFCLIHREKIGSYPYISFVSFWFLSVRKILI